MPVIRIARTQLITKDSDSLKVMEKNNEIVNGLGIKMRKPDKEFVSSVMSGLNVRIHVEFVVKMIQLTVLKIKTVVIRDRAVGLERKRVG